MSRNSADIRPKNRPEAEISSKEKPEAIIRSKNKFKNGPIRPKSGLRTRLGTPGRARISRRFA